MSAGAPAPAPAAAAPRGLPGPLPEGERILWQGGPRASALLRRALAGRAIALYFAAAGIFVAGLGWSAGRAPATVAISLVLTAAACLAVLGLAYAFAIGVARTSVYTITNRRVVLRIGVALPVTLNLPMSRIEGAGLRAYPDGTGDIPLALREGDRVAIVHLWPHARPWRLRRPEPMLRCVPDAAQVAAILVRAHGSGPLGRAAAARAEAVPDSLAPTDAVLPSAA